MATKTERRFVSAREVAEMFGHSTSTIHKWIKSGVVKAGKVGKRWLVSIESVEELTRKLKGERR